MGDRPALARDIYTKYVTDNGKVTWPKDPQTQVRLARALCGKQLVSSFDYWLSHAIDLIEKPEPSRPFPRKNEAYKEDKYFRDAFAKLSSEQKQVVWNFIRDIAHGILFSVLVDIDQGDYGEYELTLKPFGEEDNIPPIRIAPDENDELHDELSDWILSFSKYASEITELVEIAGGWQFQGKKFYDL